GGECQPNEIRCSEPGRGRKCAQKFWMCDGDRDCDDGSDEEQRYCDLIPRQRYCKTNEFQCGNTINSTNGNLVCIPRSFQCDKFNDCPDHSDEIGCAKPTIISPPQRQIEVGVGGTVTLQCTVRGSPAPYVNWRLNWGHICTECPENDRCIMTQSSDPNDPTLVTGTLTIRYVYPNDGGAYSCEALNNQGFTFAVPDAIVHVNVSDKSQVYPCVYLPPVKAITATSTLKPITIRPSGPDGPSGAGGPSGPGGPLIPTGPVSTSPTSTPFNKFSSNCDASGTMVECNDHCYCKCNVEGDRCDQCKSGHFYLNPITPDGCLSCFCSGIETECTSTDWKRKPIFLSLNDWNAVPQNFDTDSYQVGNKIERRNHGREIALNQNSLDRSLHEVLYWKAPKELLGNFITLYDGTIDIHFTNDGNDNDAPSNDAFIWLRGNNIDLIHKLPSTQRFKANTDATYSVQLNERTFTHKDGRSMKREKLLTALSNIDTLLIKINPIGGQRNAVLREVTLNIAARDGYMNAAPTVEQCHCPANYTGSSCEKCAQGYGRVCPQCGNHLGQCWSCRSLCHERSDQCDQDTGKCSNCQGNSEGDRCERCRPGYVLDSRGRQCIQINEDQQDQFHETNTQTPPYVNKVPQDESNSVLVHIDLDDSQSEQRIPFPIPDIHPISVSWSRTGDNSLPTGVVQDGNDLVLQHPSALQAGKYTCTITHADGSIQHIIISLDNPDTHNNQAGRTHPPDQHETSKTTEKPQTRGPLKIRFEPNSATLKEGQRLIVPYKINAQKPIEVIWTRVTSEGYESMPSIFTIEEDRLILHKATLDVAGTYQVTVRNIYGEDTKQLQIYVEPRRRRSRIQSIPQIRFQQDQYELSHGQTIDIIPNISGGKGAVIRWSKDGSIDLPHGVTINNDGALHIQGQSSHVAGQYTLDVTTTGGTASSTIYVQWQESFDQQHENGDDDHDTARSYVNVRFEPIDEQNHKIGYNIQLQCAVHGNVDRPYEYKFTKDDQPLANNVEVHSDGLIIILNAQLHDAGYYRCEVSFPRAPEIAAQASSYNLRLESAVTDVDDQNYQYNHNNEQSQVSKEYIEVIAEPTQLNIKRGEKTNVICRVKGAEQFKVTWSKYAHDTSLPDYAHQEGNSVVLAPNVDTPAEQMYLQCQVDIPNQTQQYHAYVPVNILDGDEPNTKKKKRYS
ncbi:unnamed protein product, partial [Adineta steineri]